VLWNVVKEINRQKGGQINVNHLQKVLGQDKAKDLFATPNPVIRF
jgi:hypothetical protein